MANQNDKMMELVNKLNKASEAYYGGQEELMTNAEWDALFDELSQLEQETGVVLPDSPTNRVGAETDADGAKEPHEYPALSLNKSKDITVLQKWAGDKAIRLSWKLDGLTLVLTYDDGKLSKILTRGNGAIGTNITYMTGAIAGIPPTIPSKGHVVVRGEATISYPDFEEINAALPAGTVPYTNPRNLAAGTMALDKTRLDEVKSRRVHFTPFTLVKGPDELEERANHAGVLRMWGKRMEWLTAQGFNCVDYSEMFFADKLPEMIAEWTDKVESGKMQTPVDGLVLVFEDTEYAKTFTVTGHHDNGAGMAFKWEDATVETTLDHIEWSCGATCITPVAVFEPVQLEGTTVRRASLHNISEANRLGIGGPGTKLRVYKANLIIPQVASAEPVGYSEVPKRCPVCGAKTEQYTKGMGMPVILRCTNPSCAAKELKKFARFVSKDGMDIDGLSEKRIADLIAGQYISSPIDLYIVAQETKTNGISFIHNCYEESLIDRDGWGVNSVTNLVNAVQKSAQNVDMAHLLYALSIPMCGHDVSKKLLEVWTPSELLDLIDNNLDSLLEQMKNIDGIGPKKTDAFGVWFSNDENWRFFHKLLEYISVKNEPRVEKGNSCAGLTFVITGAVHTFKNRAEFKTYVESNGGKVASSVSKKTDYLVSNEASNSSKSVKAATLGVPVITEDEFIARFAFLGFANAVKIDGFFGRF